jgi:CBS domain-containing membrane protein
MIPWFAGFLPAPTNVSVTERLRGALGALLGIFLTGIVSSLAVGRGLALPMLIAPMGASAVLLFAVPSSPLAQPWSILGGNLVAAFVGVTTFRFVPEPMLAAPLAIAVAIGAMATLRCLHPPSGAVALTAVLGGPAVASLGYRFVFVPVMLNSLILMLVAVAFNNATGRRYPSPQNATTGTRHGTGDSQPTSRLSFSTGDLDAVLERYDQVLDVSRYDMESLFQQAEMQAYRRRFAGMTCADIMSRDVVSVEWGTPLQEAWQRMRRHRLRAMPVVDRARHVVGLVSDVDFMNDAALDTYKTLAAKFHRLIAPPATDYTETPEVVGQIMTKTQTVTADSHVVTLVPMLADAGLRYVPIVDAEAHLVGLIAQSDLIAALYQGRLAEADGTAMAVLP